MSASIKLDTCGELTRNFCFWGVFFGRIRHFLWKQMIPFNLVFRKQALSEAHSLTSDCQSKIGGSELANSLSLPVLGVLGWRWWWWWGGEGGGRCSRCRRLALPFNLYAGGSSGSQDGGHYWVLAECLDGSQFTGGASNEEEGRSSRDGCFSHLSYLFLRWILYH